MRTEAATVRSATLVVVTMVIVALSAGTAAVAASVLSPLPAAAHEGDENDGPPVFLVHGMPGTVLEVRIGPDRRLKGLRFGQFHNLRAFAGTTLSFGFSILDTGEPVVATDGFAVPSDHSASLVVHHAADGSGALTAFDNDLDPLEPGVGRLVVRHLAAAPPLDVMVDGETVLAGVEHGWEESIELPAGEVSVTLAATDGGESSIGPVDLALTSGDRTVVYGFGSADADTLAIVTDVIHGAEGEADHGLPLRAMAVTTALAAIIGVLGFARIRRRTVPSPSRNLQRRRY